MDGWALGPAVVCYCLFNHRLAIAIEHARHNAIAVPAVDWRRRQDKFRANSGQIRGKAGRGNTMRKQGGEVVFGKAKKSRQSGEEGFGQLEGGKANSTLPNRNKSLFIFVLNPAPKQAIVQAK
jgi:hypothetical protein